MTPNKRIFLNIVATYGRSLYALVIGLFTARWVLQALGQVDYGLLGLVGGLVGFVSFFNSLLASAVGRFYAVSVGASHKTGNEDIGLEECRKWFNTALSIHSVLPVFLVISGYPIGVWAIEHFLEIPPGRLISSIWVWRFTCLSCFVGMFNVPFQAMYTAKQEIAELTFYSFVTTTLNAFFVYYMILHPGFWLTRFALWTCLLSVAPQLIISIRAVIKYEECTFNLAYLWSFDRYCELSKYAFARFWSNFSSMVSTQGHAILVNKFMGPVYNASMTVGTAVSGHANSLSGALSGAFWPAIANKAGEGDYAEMKRLSFMACRMSAVLVLVFALPLMFEIDEVLRLWLVNPPPFASILTHVFLIRFVLEGMTCGHWMAVLGAGKGILKYSWWVGWSGISAVVVSTACFCLGCGMWSVCWGLLTSKLIDVGVRLILCRTLVSFSATYWFKHVFSPICFAGVISSIGSIIVHFLISESLLRVVITTVSCEIVFLPAIFFFVLEPQEIGFVKSKFRRV